MSSSEAARRGAEPPRADSGVESRVLLPRLTSFRAYAAFGVFLYHMNGAVSWLPLRLFDFGSVGVTFFFVLSGFVLTWSIRDDSAPWRFYRRRFARVYPAALVSGLVAAVLIAVGVTPGLRAGSLGALTSIFLVQAWFPNPHYPVYSYNSVVWTLSCEAFFYALLPFLVRPANRWRSRSVIAIAGGALCAGLLATIVLAHFGHASDIGYNDPLVRLPQFLAGVALALLVLRGWRPSFVLWKACLVLGVGAAVAHRWPVMALEDYFVLPGFIAVLISGIGSDLRRQPGFLARRTSIYLGELSFCFYLVHALVLTVFMSETGWGHRTFSLLSGSYPSLVILAASLAAAVALRRLVELPMQRLLRPSRASTVSEPRRGGPTPTSLLPQGALHGTLVGVNAPSRRFGGSG
jgi:peptidoglycan/LPS O-acetylase OafA/YrhL